MPDEPGAPDLRGELARLPPAEYLAATERMTLSGLLFYVNARMIHHVLDSMDDAMESFKRQIERLS